MKFNTRFEQFFGPSRLPHGGRGLKYDCRRKAVQEQRVVSRTGDVG